jgi:hypothetical protein
MCRIISATLTLALGMCCLTLALYNFKYNLISAKIIAGINMALAWSLCSFSWFIGNLKPPKSSHRFSVRAAFGCITNGQRAWKQTLISLLYVVSLDAIGDDVIEFLIKCATPDWVVSHYYVIWWTSVLFLGLVSYIGNYMLDGVFPLSMNDADEASGFYTFSTLTKNGSDASTDLSPQKIALI